MKLEGTKFQVKVWRYLEKIPVGSIKTYSQVAKGIGKPLAVRAVANAIAKNPYPPQIPCHRVIRSNGSLMDRLEDTLVKVESKLRKNF